MHCSSSSRMTCSSKTCTALTASRRKCCRNTSCSGTMGDDDCDVEPSGDNVVGLCLGTGIAFSCARNKWEQSMPVVSSLRHLFAKPRLYTQLGMVSICH